MIQALIITGIICYAAFLLRTAYKIILSYDDCNPIKASSWIFVITFIPFFGMLAYIIFGRNLNKKKSLYEQLRNEVNLPTIAKFGYQDEECSTYPPSYGKLKKMLTHLSHMPVFPGNKVDFFSTGQEKFDQLFADLEKAKDHIHILYYTFGGDETGQRFRDIIVRKRKEGVKVRLIYDDVGSNQTKRKFFKELEKEGIETAVFSQVFMPAIRVLPRINYRNHRKIVVIDGTVGYTGGMNVKNDYVYGVKWGIWRDLHMRIEGPASQGLQAVFIVDWHYCKKEFLQESSYFPKVKNSGNVDMQVVSSEPLGIHRAIMQGMDEAISRATKTVLIQTPYFVPTASIMTTLQNTALTGIKIMLVIPYKSDNPKVQFASNSYLQQLLACNIRIFRYKKGFIHSKLIIVDDELTICGSSNMDIRSFELNFEDSVFIYDKETALKAKEIFIRDMNDSTEITLDEWRKRSRKAKFRDAFFRLFSPFL